MKLWRSLALVWCGSLFFGGWIMFVSSLEQTHSAGGIMLGGSFVGMVIIGLTWKWLNRREGQRELEFDWRKGEKLLHSWYDDFREDKYNGRSE